MIPSHGPHRACRGPSSVLAALLLTCALAAAIRPIGAFADDDYVPVALPGDDPEGPFLSWNSTGDVDGDDTWVVSQCTDSSCSAVAWTTEIYSPGSGSDYDTAGATSNDTSDTSLGDNPVPVAAPGSVLEGPYLRWTSNGGIDGEEDWLVSLCNDSSCSQVLWTSDIYVAADSQVDVGAPVATAAPGSSVNKGLAYGLSLGLGVPVLLGVAVLGGWLIIRRRLLPTSAPGDASPAKPDAGTGSSTASFTALPPAPAHEALV